MNRIKQIALAALCGAAFAASSAMANLVADPGFELDNGSWAVTGWGIGDFGRGSHTTNPNSMGTGCFAPDLTTCTFSQSLATTPGARYNISFSLYADPTGGSNGLEVLFDGASVFTIANAPDGSSPHTIDNVLATTNLTVLQFGGFHELAFIFVDDVDVSVNLSAIPEPSSLALLAAGLAGLGFLRRRKQNIAA